MKNKQLSLLLVFLIALTFGGCKEKESGSTEQTFKFDKDTSYALGMAYGSDIKNNIDMTGIVPDTNELLKGFKASLNGNSTRFDLEEAMYLIQAAFSTLTQERDAVMSQEENAFLAENSQKPGIIITSSGLQYEVIKEGNGPKPSADDTVLIHYTGTLIDGTVFDSSRERGEPQSLALNMVIPGWTEGLQLMSVGSNYKLYIPSELGYGPEGLNYGGMQLIPQYATLIFDIELINIIKN